MKNNTFDLKELCDIALKYAKENPAAALAAVAVVAGISKGISEGISKLGPYLEHAVDKAAKHLHKPTPPPVLEAVDNVDTTTESYQDEEDAA